MAWGACVAVKDRLQALVECEGKRVGGGEVRGGGK